MVERKVVSLLAPGVDEEEMAKKADLVDGKVPASQLPSYVDDVVEYASVSEFPSSGEQGKIYVALDSGFTYRWSGSEYIQIGGQDLSNYYTKDEANQLLETKQPVGDYATNTALTSGLATKQNTLVSGTNIKTINGNSILGNGNLTIDTVTETRVQEMIDASISSAIGEAY